VEAEKASLFKVYEQYIVQDPPDCLSTLRRMLQAGPVTRLYTGGGGKYVGSHEGYSLRMPPAEVPDWQMVNDKGDLLDALVTSTKTVSMEALGNRDYAAAFEGTFSSRWSQLVVDTKL
jgi:hypothetical protein